MKRITAFTLGTALIMGTAAYGCEAPKGPMPEHLNIEGYYKKYGTNNVGPKAVCAYQDHKFHLTKAQMIDCLNKWEQSFQERCAKESPHQAECLKRYHVRKPG